MNNNDTTPSIVPITADVAKARINLALTGAEMSIQAMQTKVDTLVYNEDNLPAIKETVLAIGKIEKKIEEAFKEGKKPYKDGVDSWDAAKRDLIALISPIAGKANYQHTKLCQAVEKRKRDNAAAEKRKKDIQDKIIATILGFSQEITACKTNKELLAVESRINLEKTRTQTYGEQLPTLIERCNELTELLKLQKTAVKQLDQLDSAAEFAFKIGDDESLQEIEAKKEEIGGIIQETKIRVEESAINSSTRGYVNNGITQSFPEVKTKRKTWKAELFDIRAAVKNDLSLLKVELNPEFIKVKLNTLKETGILMEGIDGKEDVVINGIRYYLSVTY